MIEIVTFLLKAFCVIALGLLLIAGIMVVYRTLFGKKKSNSTEEGKQQVLSEQSEKTGETGETEELEQQEPPSTEPIVYPYKLTNCIFSDKEKYFYRDIKPIADKLGLLVFTKMRLADLLYIPNGTENSYTWFNKIKAKHIDFIITDNDYKIKLLVEVDDPTHNRQDRKARDEEVDEIFRQQGMNVLHLRAWGKRYGQPELETIISEALKSELLSQPFREQLTDTVGQ